MPGDTGEAGNWDFNPHEGVRETTLDDAVTKDSSQVTAGDITDLTDLLAELQQLGVPRRPVDIRRVTPVLCQTAACTGGPRA